MIFGICGLAGSGKDTLADNIIRANPTFKKIKMATFLKDAVSVLFSWNREWLDGNTPEQREWREQVDEFWNEAVDIKLRPFTPRKALQFVGTELFRNQVCPNFWVLGIKKYIQQNPGNYIIPDCRFPEELKMVVELGGTNIEVRRNEPEWYDSLITLHENGIYDKDKELTKLHESETRWIGDLNIYEVCNNNKGIDDLYYYAKDLLLDYNM